MLCASAFAQPSPWQTGATSLQNEAYAIRVPVAALVIIGVGVAAMANRLSWGSCIEVIAGIAIAFGATQMVGWIRAAFSV